MDVACFHFFFSCPFACIVVVYVVVFPIYSHMLFRYRSYFFLRSTQMSKDLMWTGFVNAYVQHVTQCYIQCIVARNCKKTWETPLLDVK
jgi:hypothetical protein